MGQAIPLTEEYRGDLLDLTHFGHIAVVDETGRVIYSAGDPSAVIFYRSASKPVQALPVFAHGIKEKYGITDEESVIFAASHAGEPFHVAALESIFKKAGLSEDQLIMNPAVPAYGPANEARIRAGIGPRKFFHNCSGKHAALMLLQKELTGSPEGYEKIDSPCQQEVLRTVAALSEYPADQTQLGIDGCGVPVFAVGLKNIATAYKNLACIDTIADPDLRRAAGQLVPLMHQYPHMIRGTGYLCSEINYDGNIVAKGGALGVYGLGLKKERLGIAFKLTDGTETDWPLIIREIFRQIGYHNEETEARLLRLNDGILRNDNNTIVGTRKAVFTLENHA